MNELRVKTDTHQYSVHFKKGLNQQLPDMLKAAYRNSRFAVIMDANVLQLYGNEIKQGFDLAGISFDMICVEPGEKSKCIGMYAEILSRLAQRGYNRADVIVALGGGVVGDLSGFVAATYLRGIRYVQVPTTLLAQIDSSVGGKTAVNLPEGKNLAGAFYQPSAVYIDTSYLATLNRDDFADGMAEMIKYALIKDQDMFDILENSAGIDAQSDGLKDLIIRCLAIKRDVVAADEKDKGERMLLNFGHTIGHGLERMCAAAGQPITHGQAVARGMVAITAASERQGQTRTGTARRIADLLDQTGLPSSIDGFDKTEILKGIFVDKKNMADMLNIILLKEPGHAFIQPIRQSEMEKYL